MSGVLQTHEDDEREPTTPAENDSGEEPSPPEFPTVGEKPAEG